MAENPMKKVALCLSGGGYRAALFHLGAIWRLNELGVLPRIDTISSVSGGSVLAAHLALHASQWPCENEPIPDFRLRIAEPFFEFTKRNIRTRPVLRRLLPWNWFRSGFQATALEGRYHKLLTKQMLAELPKRPNFVFCATDMVFGVSWVFERSRVGSWEAGYIAPPAAWTVAKAVAGSTCFPPFYSPMKIDYEIDQKVRDSAGNDRTPVKGMRISDGGLYDNFGMQPAENHDVLLVSDGGAPYVSAVPTGVVSQLRSYIDVISKQAGSLRKRWLISQYRKKEKEGAYWGVVSSVERYGRPLNGAYSKELAQSIISMIRTDMDSFTTAEIAILINHGYFLGDTAVRVHADDLIGIDAELNAPYSDFLDEGKVRSALADSHEHYLFGRN